MKKFFKALSFITVAVVLVFVYNYFTGYSLFELDFFSAPSYQEEIEEYSENTQSAPFEKLYYSQLDDNEKKVYDRVYFAIKDYKESVRIYQKIDNDDLFDIISFVLAENPELFWSNGSCTISTSGKLTFKYIYTLQEVEYYKTEIEKNTANIIAQANAITDQYERALLLFNFISESITYDDDAAENISEYPQVSTIAGALVDKKAVCGGYSKAYQYLLSKCALNAETVYGTAQTPDGEESHAWTLQYLDGNYYYTDATWGDSLEGKSTQDCTSHIYFCMTEKDMSKTHTLKSNISYPQCTAKADNYFIREGLYFSKFSKSAIKKAIRSQIESGNNFIEMKFENSSDYNNAVEELLTKEGISYLLFEIDPFQIRIDTTSLSYSTDDTRNVLTLILNKK